MPAQKIDGFAVQMLHMIACNQRHVVRSREQSKHKYAACGKKLLMSLRKEDLKLKGVARKL